MRAVWLTLVCACHHAPPASHDDAASDGPAPCFARGTNVQAVKIADVCDPGVMAPCPDRALTLVSSPPNDPRLFAVEQVGEIRVIDNGEVKPDPFIDLTYADGGPVYMRSELGLLGLAFDPSYATNHTFYVFYTSIHRGGTLPYYDILARYTTSATDPDKADPASGQIILQIDDPYSNHNGGMIAFGADGYLYVATGDGGGAGDVAGNAQNPQALLGKILRIDVEHPSATKPYSIPADNPFADGTAGAPEVFILGVRNPWRWSFDRETGDMWIADVGQELIEELDVLPSGAQAGKNLGWNMYEGNSCYKAPCTPDGMTFPQHTRAHSTGWAAIIGGEVYRGSCYPDLRGTYLFTDYMAHGLAAAKLQPDGSLTVADLPGTFPAEPSSIHGDAEGELYLTTVGGEIYRLEVSP